MKPRPTPEEMLRVAVEHSWDNENGNYRHRRQFQAIGISSKQQLEEELSRAIRDKGARSFDRQPNPARNQTEHTTIFQARLLDRANKEHQVTVILNPDRDDQGKLHGGTTFLNEPNRRPDIHRLFADEKARGNNPRFFLREADLAKPACASRMTPAHKLIYELSRDGPSR